MGSWGKRGYLANTLYELSGDSLNKLDIMMLCSRYFILFYIFAINIFGQKGGAGYFKLILI